MVAYKNSLVVIKINYRTAVFSLLIKSEIYLLRIVEIIGLVLKNKNIYGDNSRITGPPCPHRKFTEI